MYAEIINTILSLFGKSMDGSNIALSAQTNQDAQYNGFINSTGNAPCIFLQDKINTEIDACTAYKKNGLEGFFVNYNNAHATCESSIKNKYFQEIANCQLSITQPKKPNYTFWILATIVIVIILIIIFKK
jgi:hypothetical protein